MFDEFVIDSFTTGLQRLICLGVRTRTPNMREKDLIGKPGELPEPGTYIRLIQGIYALSSPEITAKPHIRNGVCGAALLRISKGSEKKTDQVLQARTLSEGGIGGFMHWADLQSKTTEKLLCYSDATDELIQDGWMVSQMPDKRAMHHEEEEGEAGPSTKRK